MNLLPHIEQKNEKKLVTFLNPYSYLFARNKIGLFKNFNIKIDGIILVKTLNIFGFKNIIRESFDMTSMAPLVFEESIKTKKSIYFIGTKPEIIDKAADNIKEQFPELNIIGYRDGYIKEEERNEVLKSIITLNPDILICGMGTPVQEQFLIDLQKSGWSGTGYTCGGFLHQTANSIKYYPNWVNKYNLRALYRIYDEPVLLKRYLFEYPKFVYYFFVDYINYKFVKSK